MQPGLPALLEESRLQVEVLVSQQPELRSLREATHPVSRSCQTPDDSMVVAMVLLHPEWREQVLPASQQVSLPLQPSLQVF